MNELEKKGVNFGGYGYRVGGVIIKNGKILLHSDQYNDFWVVPSGGVKPFEASNQAIIREFKEEIGIDVTVERLLFIIENSFEFMGEKIRGIELMFLVNPLRSEEKLEQEEFIGFENEFYPEIFGELKLTYRWFKPSELDEITIKPQILKEALKNIPDYPKLLRNLEI